MKRVILLLLLIASPCQAENIQLARMNPYVAGSGGAAACNYTGCSAGCKLFDWDCTTDSMASNVCSLGDTTATLEGEANLTTPGYLTMVDDTNNGNDNYKFAISSYNIFPAADATIEITVNLSVAATTSQLFSAYFDGNNLFQIYVSGATRDIALLHKGNGTSVTMTADVNLTLNESHTIVAKISTTNGMSVKVDANAAIVDDTKDITKMTHSGTNSTGFTVGNDSSANMEGTITNVRVSAGWRTDI